MIPIVVAAGLMIAAAPPSSPAADSLAAALGREHRALRAERAALRKALEEEAKTRATAEARLTRAIERTQLRLQKLRAAPPPKPPVSERARAADRAVRHDLAEKIRHHRLVETGTAARHGDPAERLLADLRGLFRHTHLRGGIVLEKDAPYFDESGRQARGPILWLGQVSATLWRDPPAALGRAGDGTLEVADSPARAADRRPAGRLVDVVLFHPAADGHPHAAPSPSLENWLKQGGPIMIVIAVIAALAAAIAALRTWRLLLYTVQLLRGRPLPVPMPVPSPAAGSGAATAASGPDPRRAALRGRLSGGLSLLGIAAAVAPLLGLLGTVTGMIGTFRVLTHHGSGDPQLVSGGISEALLTTQFGLAVAIPAMVLRTALLRWADALARRTLAQADAPSASTPSAFAETSPTPGHGGGHA